jgi:hypothetical protein
VTIIIPGISHNSFSDIRLLGRMDPGSINLWPKDVQLATPNAHILQLISSVTRAFFDTYLRGGDSSKIVSFGPDEVRVERFGKAAR